MELRWRKMDYPPAIRGADYSHGFLRSDVVRFAESVPRFGGNLGRWLIVGEPGRTPRKVLIAQLDAAGDPKAVVDSTGAYEPVAGRGAVAHLKHVAGKRSLPTSSPKPAGPERRTSKPAGRGKIEYDIALGDRRTETVTGIPIGKYLGLEHVGKGKKSQWNLTHIPTGLRIQGFVYKRDAMEIAREIDKSGGKTYLDTGNETVVGQGIKAAGLVEKIRAARIGIVRAPKAPKSKKPTTGVWKRESAKDSWGHKITYWRFSYPDATYKIEKDLTTKLWRVERSPHSNLAVSDRVGEYKKLDTAKSAAGRHRSGGNVPPSDKAPEKKWTWAQRENFLLLNIDEGGSSEGDIIASMGGDPGLILQTVERLRKKNKIHAGPKGWHKGPKPATITPRHLGLSLKRPTTIHAGGYPYRARPATFGGTRWETLTEEHRAMRHGRTPDGWIIVDSQFTPVAAITFDDPEWELQQLPDDTRPSQREGDLRALIKSGPNPLRLIDTETSRRVGVSSRPQYPSELPPPTKQRRTMKAVERNEHVMNAIRRAATGKPSDIGLREPEIAAVNTVAQRGITEAQVYTAVAKLKKEGRIEQTVSKGWIPAWEAKIARPKKAASKRASRPVFRLTSPKALPTCPATVYAIPIPKVRRADILLDVKEDLEKGTYQDEDAARVRRMGADSRVRRVVGLYFGEMVKAYRSLAKKEKKLRQSGGWVREYNDQIVKPFEWTLEYLYGKDVPASQVESNRIFGVWDQCARRAAALKRVKAREKKIAAGPKAAKKKTAKKTAKKTRELPTRTWLDDLAELRKLRREVSGPFTLRSIGEENIYFTTADGSRYFYKAGTDADATRALAIIKAKTKTKTKETGLRVGASVSYDIPPTAFMPARFGTGKIKATSGGPRPGDVLVSVDGGLPTWMQASTVKKAAKKKGTPRKPPGKPGRRFLGPILRSHREKKGITPAALAKAMGISTSTLNGIERGKIRCPPVARLEGASKILHVRVGILKRANDCDYGKTAKKATKKKAGRRGASEKTQDQRLSAALRSVV